MMTEGLFSLEGRVALVTGGNSGLGRGIARGYRAAGAQVVVTGRNPDKNAAMVAEFGDTKAVIALEVQDEAAVKKAVDHVVGHFGRIDILVNNAGLFRGGPILEMALDDWNTVMGAHLTGPYLCSKYAGQKMRDQGEGGKIINIGSMYSVLGPPNAADYAAAKAGVLGLTRSMATELAAYNIQVNAILPGWFETDMTRGLPARPRGEEIRKHTPAGRWGEDADMVGAAIFLASPASDFVTGVSLPVDGGYLLSERELHD
jgi:2-deoxy-D-gluconate 3-dehydrogenase